MELNTEAIRQTLREKGAESGGVFIENVRAAAGNIPASSAFVFGVKRAKTCLKEF
jgi:hypothetical protein